MEKFEPTGYGNEVLKTKWGYISYNPDTSRSVLGGMITDFLNLYGQDVEDGQETALYTNNDNKWRILKGDFRNEYLKVFPDKGKCIKLYIKNKNIRSNYSTDKL